MSEHRNLTPSSRRAVDSKDIRNSGQGAGGIRSISEILSGKNTVALGGHVRPDGDCVGSCVGLYLYIKKNFPQIEVDVYLEEVPLTFQQLVGVRAIKHQVANPTKSYDLFITLDCAEVERLGFALPVFRNGKETFCVDHHVSNIGFADVNHIVPEASSTSELVFYLLEEDKMDIDMANALFLGIVHDTGCFRFNNTSPETMEVAASLLRMGVQGDEIIEKTYFERTYQQTKIIGKALSECELSLDGKCLFYVLTAQEMKKYNVGTSDLDGIVSQLWLTKDIEVALFMYELEGHDFKVSLRSSDQVDVSEIAKKFGGGGHKRAAGFEMKASSEVILRLVWEEMEKYGLRP